MDIIHLTSDIIEPRIKHWIEHTVNILLWVKFISIIKKTRFCLQVIRKKSIIKNLLKYG